VINNIIYAVMFSPDTKPKLQQKLGG